MGAGRATGATRASATIRTGATWSLSPSTSAATVAAGSVPATRAGPPSPSVASKIWPGAGRGDAHGGDVPRVHRVALRVCRPGALRGRALPVRRARRGMPRVLRLPRELRGDGEAREGGAQRLGRPRARRCPRGPGEGDPRGPPQGVVPAGHCSWSVSLSNSALPTSRLPEPPASQRPTPQVVMASVQAGRALTLAQSVPSCVPLMVLRRTRLVSPSSRRPTSLMLLTRLSATRLSLPVLEV